MAGDTGLGATIANLGNIWESKVAPKIQASVDALDKAVLNMNKLGGSFGGGGGFGGGNNKVSNLPPGAVAGLAAGGQALAAVGQAMPSTNMYVQQDLLTNRARFFAMGGQDTTSTFIDANGNRVGFKMGGGSGMSAQNNNVVNLQNTLNQRGTITDQLDAAKALVQAQNSGLAGARNFNQVMIGNAAMSNITPGIGIQGSTQAYAAVQQGRNVNMLRAIGIQVRGMDGSMKPMPQIIDEVWNKLNREKVGSQPLTEQDILTSLQPGNALDSMLNLYFGNDSMLRSQVEQGLLIKAKTGGSRNLDSITKKELQNMGVTTAAVTSLSNRNAAASRVLQQTAGFGAGGFTLSNQLASDLSKIANAMTPLLDVVASFSTLFSGIMGIGNGLVKGLMSPIAFLLGLGKREKGGPVDNKTPYVVGEKGPELFIPSTDGNIVSNHDMKSIFRDAGGEVSSKGSNPNAFAQALLKGLGVAPNDNNVEALTTWMRFEGGGGGKATGIGVNKANWNPLNTTLSLPGAKSVNSVGVKSYASMDQGLQATIQTLTAGSASKYGYTAIVDALKSGSKDDILAAIDKSAWRTGKTGGAGAYNWTGKGKNVYGGAYGTGSSVTNTDTSSPSSLKDFLSGSSDSGMASFLKGKDIGANTTHTYNVGGVNITISGNSDPASIADAVASILTDKNLRAKAGQS